jgi:hypothetical protein
VLSPSDYVFLRAMRQIWEILVYDCQWFRIDLRVGQPDSFLALSFFALPPEPTVIKHSVAVSYWIQVSGREPGGTPNVSS